MDTRESNASADPSKLREELQTALTAADQSSGAAVGKLESVHRARLSLVSRQVRAARRELGDDDPAVKQLESQAAAITGTVARIAVVKNQIATPSPDVAPNGWALHGRVFHADMTPARAFTVFLVDAGKAYQKAFPFAYTDETGYFLINYSGSAAGAETPAAQDLFVEVADSKGRPVYLDAAPFTPEAGTVAYRNLVLGSGDQAIGDPPKEIRDVAIPKTRKK